MKKLLVVLLVMVCSSVYCIDWQNLPRTQEEALVFLEDKSFVYIGEGAYSGNLINMDCVALFNESVLAISFLDEGLNILAIIDCALILEKELIRVKSSSTAILYENNQGQEIVFTIGDFTRIGIILGENDGN